MPESGYGALAQVVGSHALKGGVNVETLAANKTLLVGDLNHQKIDPAGARTITLPAEASSNGLWFAITNIADAAEDVTVTNDAAVTIVTISQNEKALVMCDGTTWVHTGIVTIALS